MLMKASDLNTEKVESQRQIGGLVTIDEGRLVDANESR